MSSRQLLVPRSSAANAGPLLRPGIGSLRSIADGACSLVIPSLSRGGGIWGKQDSYQRARGCCPARAKVLFRAPALRLGDSLAVKLPALTRASLVRIQVPQDGAFRQLKHHAFLVRPAERGPQCGLCPHNVPTSHADAGSTTIADAFRDALRARSWSAWPPA